MVSVQPNADLCIVFGINYRTQSGKDKRYSTYYNYYLHRTKRGAIKLKDMKDKKSRLPVFLCCCFVTANPFATVLTFGTLYLPLLERYGEDRAETATVQAVAIGMMTSTSVLWGVLSRRFGLSAIMWIGSVLVPAGYLTAMFTNTIYQLTICIGVIAGVGTSMVYLCSNSIVAKTFTGKENVVAIAVLQAASGTGTIGYPYLLNYLQGQYGLCGTFLITGGINLNNIAVAILIHCSNTSNSAVIDRTLKPSTACQQKDATHVNNWKHHCHKTSTMIHSGIINLKELMIRIVNFRSLMVLVITTLTVSSLDGFNVVVMDFFESRGFSSVDGVNSFSVYNALGIVGNLVPILFQIKAINNPLLMFVVFSACGCVGQALMFVSSELAVLFVGRGLMGLAIGGLIVSSVVALSQCVEIEVFNEAFGLLMTCAGVLACMFGPLFGWLRDEFQSYDAVLALTTSLHGVACVLSVIAMCRTHSYEPECDVQLDVPQQPNTERY